MHDIDSTAIANGWLLHLVDIDAGWLESPQGALPEGTTIADSRLEDPAACATALLDAPERIRTLVHLAGTFVPHDLVPDSHEIYDQSMQYNAPNAFDLAGVVMPRMTDGGHIVLTSSLGFNRGVPGHAAYSMAKGAIAGLNRTLARRTGDRRSASTPWRPGSSKRGWRMI